MSNEHKTSNEIINDVNENQQTALAALKINQNLEQQGELEIENGIDRKRKMEETQVVLILPYLVCFSTSFGILKLF